MDDLTPLQLQIMIFIKHRAKKKKTLVCQKEVVDNLRCLGFKSYSIVNGLKSLLEKGYLREAIMMNSNETFYVMIRNIYEDF